MMMIACCEQYVSVLLQLLFVFLALAWESTKHYSVFILDAGYFVQQVTETDQTNKYYAHNFNRRALDFNKHIILL